jgi:DNA (cytosine-5)-methyltransferase 1
MKVLDLFSGIGGFSLGLERAGMQTVAFCEIDPYCRRVLAKHWPEVPIYDDVRKLSIGRLAADGIDADVICGGFPCQDISVAGKGKGIEGERSGLWSEFARLIGELRPRYAIVENVSNLLGRGLDRVLGDLASLGYDAEWHCIPAAAAGAPHNRDRIWIVAYPDSRRPAQYARRERHIGVGPFLGSKTLADANTSNEQRGSGALQMGWGRFAREATQDGDARRAEWSPEPGVGRVAHGVSNRVDRLGGLGNAVVPQIPEMIGRAILASRSAQ